MGFAIFPASLFYAACATYIKSNGCGGARAECHIPVKIPGA
jgi:hypothetical protein